MKQIKLVTHQLQHALTQQIEQAEAIFFVISFIQPSGVQLLLPTLEKAAERGVEIKILCGDYLYITHPEALEMLHQALPQAELRLFKSEGVSFHPKAYLFRLTDQSHAFIGSSNLSRSGLTHGVEWNVHAQLEQEDAFFEEAFSAFIQLFYHDQSIALNALTIEDYRFEHQQANAHYNLSEQLEEASIEPGPSVLEQTSSIEETALPYIVQPRPAQLLALEALETTIEEGYDKALVVLATGLGKTFLSAFFAKAYPRVLFIAHREELLNQAQQTFQQIHPQRSTGLYYGKEKNKEVDFLFASIFTLSTVYHLNQFSPDAFDLIIIDEFHHATAPSYERVLAYFKPQFLLGITATPDRLDNKDVYAICDGNVALSIHFLDAIRQGWLSPFTYHGVKDPTDYQQLQWRNGNYDEQELLFAQTRTNYAQIAFEKWMKLKQTRSLGFCSSVQQANFMANYFEKKGFKALALHSQTDSLVRKQAIGQLTQQQLDIIFTVDLFNEGIDIPLVDTLLFLRPTQSLTVFTQQIGRGLRLAEQKEQCVIIDLIGNYHNADLKLSVFESDSTATLGAVATSPESLPDNCAIHLETEVIHLLHTFKKKNSPRKEQVKAGYWQLKRELGRRPTYLELHLKATFDSRLIHTEFQSFPRMLAFLNELTREEEKVMEEFDDLLMDINRTSMSKSYKMALLQALLQRGPSNWYRPIQVEQLSEQLLQDYRAKKYKQLIEKKDFHQMTPQQMTQLMLKNPVHFWSHHKNSFLKVEETTIAFDVEPLPHHERPLYEWVKQICEYRLHVYFERKSEKLLH